MAYSSTDYSSWAGNVGEYRLRLNITLLSQSESANTSTVRIRAWMESRASSSFAITSSYRLIFDGDTLIDSSGGVTCPANGSVQVMDRTRTISHNSNGERSVTASARFSNSLSGTHNVSTTLNIDRIDQLPDKPGAAPTLVASGLSVEITSATADPNGGTITGYEARWRPAGGSWTTLTLNTSTRKGTFTAPGGTVEAVTRARTARGWGPYSSTRTLVVGTEPDQIAAVNLVRGTRSLTGGWSAPGNGGLPILRYETELWDGRAWSPTRDVGTTAATTFTDLLPGIAHKIRARAVNALGPGAWRESTASIPFGCSCSS